MSITSALNTLLTSKLRFTQLRKLDDQWEGAITPATITSYKELMSQISSDFQREIPDQEDSLRMMQLMNRFHNYVSYWTINAPDQMQMWDAYSEGVEWCCIETTVVKLQNSLLEVPDIADICTIKYVDPDTEPIDGIDMRREICRKRVAFEHEREVRFTINTTHIRGDRERLLLEEPPYLSEDFNPKTIHSIVIHPNAPEGSEDNLRVLLSSASMETRVARCAIARTPPYSDFRD
jgi:hypothetical protein